MYVCLLTVISQLQNHTSKYTTNNENKDEQRITQLYPKLLIHTLYISYPLYR